MLPRIDDTQVMNNANKTTKQLKVKVHLPKRKSTRHPAVDPVVTLDGNSMVADMQNLPPSLVDLMPQGGKDFLDPNGWQDFATRAMVLGLL